jgi:mono/diheme cytochrome c family protein
MRSVVIAIPLTLAVLLAGGCGKSSQPPPGSGTPSAQQEAQAMFDKRCAVCHGAGGAGDGPSADSFQPRPGNYTDPAWQASITDDQIKEIILKGGANLGKSPAMPSNTLLRERPEVLDGLVKIIRGFGKRP